MQTGQGPAVKGKSKSGNGRAALLVVLGAVPWQAQAESAAPTALVAQAAAPQRDAEPVGEQAPGARESQQAPAEGDALTLPAVTVRESAASPAIGLSKSQQSWRETPQSVTVIDAERMREQNLVTLDEVMQRAAPGVTVQPYQQLTTQYYQRGFLINSFEQDGVPILMGNTASPSQDMGMYERVEILRGAAGLMHGTGNPSATVNLVPKRPQRQFAASVDGTLGSWERRRGQLDMGGPLNAAGSLRARMVLSQENRNFFTDVAHHHSGQFYGVAELDLGAATVLSAGLQKQRIRSLTDMAGVPFGRDGQDLRLPRSTFLNTDWSHFNWDTTRSFAGLEHLWDSGWKAKLMLNHLSADSDLLYAGANGAVDLATGTGPRLTGAAYRFDNSQTSADAYVSGPLHAWGREHELVLGMNRQRTSSTQWAASFVGAGSPLGQNVDVWGWNPHGTPPPTLGAFATRGPTDTEQTGAYGMARLRLSDPLTLVLGARWTRWEQTAAAVKTRMPSAFTPYGGVVYALTPQWTAYGSYARILDPQTKLDASGRALDPVQGNNLEAGIKGELLDKRLALSMAVFEIRQKNRAMADPDLPCVGNSCWYVASGQVRSRGLELEAQGQLSSRLQLSASYSWNTTKYLRDALNEGLPYASFAPRQIARVWFNYRLPFDANRWSVGGGLQAQSSFYNQSQGVRLSQGGYALAHLQVGYRMTPKVQATLHVNNLTDKRYYQSLAGTGWSNRYGEPRSAMLSLRAEY